jgi:hypothetical protein
MDSYNFLTEAIAYVTVSACSNGHPIQYRSDSTMRVVTRS